MGAEGPEFLAISLEDGPAVDGPEGSSLRTIADAYGYRGPIAVAASEDGMLDPLGIRRVPGLAFVDRRGVIVTTASGPRKRTFIAEQARAAARR